VAVWVTTRADAEMTASRVINARTGAAIFRIGFECKPATPCMVWWWAYMRKPVKQGENN